MIAKIYHESRGAALEGVGNTPIHERVGKLIVAFIRVKNWAVWIWSNLNLNNYKLNSLIIILKSQVNRYLENVLYRVVAGNLKIQNSPIAYNINADVLDFDSGHGCN
jgi:hypothetical protein